jgi:hypothetical protein
METPYNFCLNCIIFESCDYTDSIYAGAMFIAERCFFCTIDWPPFVIDCL